MDSSDIAPTLVETTRRNLENGMRVEATATAMFLHAKVGKAPTLRAGRRSRRECRRTQPSPVEDRVQLVAGERFALEQGEQQNRLAASEPHHPPGRRANPRP